MNRARRSIVVLFLLLTIGAFVGNVIGELLVPVVPIFAHRAALGISPATLRLLNVLEVTAGVSLNLSLLGALGALFGLFLWWR